jgi:long-chain fatty acid transport protein
LRRSLPPVLAVAVLLLTSDAMAGGFNIYEMGARATSLGGAFTATADDGSAIFYNPAGLAYHPDGWGISLSVSPLNPQSKFTRATGQTPILYPGDANSETTSNWYLPTGAYFSWKREKLSAGFGFFTPFGLGVEWDRKSSFAGRPLSTNSQIQGYYLSPVVAYRVHEKVAVSVGAHVVKTHLDLKSIRTANLGTGTGVTDVADVELSGTSDWTVGLAAAVMAKPVEHLTLGVNYKMGVKNEFKDQDATFTQIETGSPTVDAQVRSALLAQVGMLGTQNVSADLEFPDMVMMAARYDFTERFGLEADAVWIGWSAFDKVVLDFEGGFQETLEENYEDVWQFRFGAEYAATSQIRCMVGYVRDNSPQPTGSISPLLPDADRNDFSVGATWTSGNGLYDVTAGYMLVAFDERSTVENGVGQNYDQFDGTYDSLAHIITLGVNRRF